MRTRRLGSAGPEITTVGFGAWAIGGPWRFGWGSVNDEDSVAAVRHAVELGVNWVDTAAVYGLGHSEEIVRRALEPYRAGEDVYVFTKCGRRWEGRPEGVIENDLRPESIREECDASLRRLGVERIDLYQAHWPDWTTGTLLEDSWGTMAELVDEGKVRWIGVSNFDESLLARCEAIRHVDSVQPTLSLLQRGSLQAIIPWAAEHGAGVICYSPMASGLLTGSFDRERLAASATTTGGRCRPRSRSPTSRAALPSSSAYVGSRTSWRRRPPRSQWRGCSRSPASPARSSAVVPPATSTAGRPHRSSRWTPGRSRRSPGRSRRPAPARTSRPRHRRTSGLRPLTEAAVRLGLLSTARINDAILGGAKDTDRVDVVAVASRDAARAEAYAVEHGLERSHGSYEALLADDEIDGVYISLPNRLHHEWTLAALDAGKHVLCEKPYSRRPAEVEEAYDRAGSAGLVLMEAFMYRHQPQTRRSRRSSRTAPSAACGSFKAAFRFVLPTWTTSGRARSSTGAR